MEEVVVSAPNKPLSNEERSTILNKAITDLKLKGQAEAAFRELISDEINYNLSLAMLDDANIKRFMAKFDSKEYQKMPNKSDFMTKADFERIIISYKRLQNQQSELRQLVEKEPANLSAITNKILTLQNNYMEYISLAGGVRVPPVVDNATQLTEAEAAQRAANRDPSRLPEKLGSLLVRPTQRSMRYNMLAEAISKQFTRQRNPAIDEAVLQDVAALLLSTDAFANACNHGQDEYTTNQERKKVNEAQTVYDSGKKKKSDQVNFLHTVLDSGIPIDEKLTKLHAMDMTPAHITKAIELYAQKLNDELQRVGSKIDNLNRNIQRDEEIVQNAKAAGREPSFYKEELGQLQGYKKDLAKAEKAKDNLNRLQQGILSASINQKIISSVNQFLDKSSKRSSMQVETQMLLAIQMECLKALKSGKQIEFADVVAHAAKRYALQQEGAGFNSKAEAAAEFVTKLEFDDKSIFKHLLGEINQSYDSMNRQARMSITADTLIEGIFNFQKSPEWSASSSRTPSPRYAPWVSPDSSPESSRRPRKDFLGQGQRRSSSPSEQPSASSTSTTSSEVTAPPRRPPMRIQRGPGAPRQSENTKSKTPPPPAVTGPPPRPIYRVVRQDNKGNVVPVERGRGKENIKPKGDAITQLRQQHQFQAKKRSHSDNSASKPEFSLGSHRGGRRGPKS